MVAGAAAYAVSQDDTIKPRLDLVRRVAVFGLRRAEARGLDLADPPGAHPALFATERRGRMSDDVITAAFCTARDAARLPGELDLHCPRHSYVTHQLAGLDVVGHLSEMDKDFI
jgi:hypothetical protein